LNPAYPIGALVGALALSAMAISPALAQSDKTAPSWQGSADILLGKPYNGPRIDTPRGQDGKPVLSGFWKLLHEDGKPDGNLGKDEPGFALPYSDRGKAALAADYKTIDPEARCIILGLPRLSTSVLPFEILQTSQRVGFFYQLSWHRSVPLNGGKLDADPDPRFFGNSVSRWDGDTLVIESVAFSDSADGKVWLDDNANPISAKAKIIERWTRPDFNHLNLELTLIDPDYYTRPVHYHRSWVLGAPGEALHEFSCEWNTWWVTHKLEPGPGVIGANGNRGFGAGNQIVPELPLGAVEGLRGVGYWLYRSNKPKPSDLPQAPAAAAAPR